MTTHMTGTREEWLAARLELLQAEKALTRQSDELAQRRQALPWVRVDKAYRFETEEGSASLADLFEGRSQLLVYHFMFGPDYKAGCPVLLGDRRRVRRLRRPSGEPRRHAVGGVAGAARQAAGLQAADGLDAFPGPPRRAATSTSTSTSRSPRSSSAQGASNTTTGAAAMSDGRRAGPGTRRRDSRRPAAPTRPPSRATGRA